MKSKVIYIEPGWPEDFDFEVFYKLPDSEKLRLAQNEYSWFMDVHSIDSFEYAFNSEQISDLGFITFV